MLSVIIPAYNNLTLLKTALISVQKQIDIDVEIIIVDDSSNDEIEGYLKNIQDVRIHYYHNKPSKGAVDNWNYGLSLAKGDKLILLHHDESFANISYLSRVNKLLGKYDVVIHNKCVMLAGGEKKDRVPNIVKRIILYLKYPIFSLNVIGPCACVAFKRSAFVEFDNRLHWKVDVEWYFRLLKRSKRYIYIKTSEVISHHGHKEQITNNINIEEVNREDCSIINKKYNMKLVSWSLVFGRLLRKLK